LVGTRPFALERTSSTTADLITSIGEGRTLLSTARMVMKRRRRMEKEEMGRCT
jgi:hypothetical protein